MATRYNIGIVGPGARDYRAILKRRLHKRLRELGDDVLSVVAFLDAVSILRRDPKTPVVLVYFGGSDFPAAEDLGAVRSLLASKAVIIPVVPDLKNYSISVPLELHDINAAALSTDDRNLDAITNLVLENLALLRRSRRLFISYRRTDSSREALQIRHELDARGYDVFLDTHSVPKGDAFQEVLWQRLADSDVAILLDTPGFLESRWTKEELAQAEAMTIGLIQVIWPSRQPISYTDLCERIYLTNSDFKSDSVGGLTPTVLKQIAAAVEQLRARSLAARHDNLVREFCDAAASVSVPAFVQPERFISARLPSGKLIAAIPAVGVPDALRYHEASLRFAAGEDLPSQVFLIYDHRGLRPSWSNFLDWLDDFLPVKAVRITDVVHRLRSK